ncbi:hypothetical protein [Serratia nevei]|uniref:DUF7940 domain-containing protein n=1 Tax=Serratia nevei TaxID=2703794 RepID=UPI00249A74AF|nr:hypothetical protein [Serratia nevei]MDI3149368.1 hypothetical protein [Serratia nevei]
MKLIDDWAKAWKYFSVQCFALAGAISAGWGMYGDVIKQYIPAQYMPWIICVVAIAGIVGRFVDQPSTDKPQ